MVVAAEVEELVVNSDSGDGGETNRRAMRKYPCPMDR